MRDRAWRRHTEDKIVIKRIKFFVNYSQWRHITENGDRCQTPSVGDYIGSKRSHLYKSSSNYYDNHKIKYSPNRSKIGWRDKNKRGNRELHRKEFLNILKENGLK
jgi:outer membrane phospholipase A